MKSFLEYVVSTADSELSVMIKSRILPSFLQSVRKNKIQEFSELALRLWIVDLLFSEIKATTIKRYLGGLHTLYKEWIKTNNIAADDPFKEVLKIMPDLTQPDKLVRESHKNISRIIRQIQEAPDPVSTSMFLYLLYNVNASLKDVIDLKFDDFKYSCPQLVEIVNRMQNGRKAKYVFPLGHGDRRISLITKEANTNMRDLLNDNGFRFGSSFSRDSITALWIQAAWQSGIDVLTIRSMLKSVPEEFSFLSILASRSVAQEENEMVIEKVANSLCDRTMRWFAMKLRAGKSPEDVKCSLKEASPDLFEKLTFYYPTRKIVKKLRKKSKTIDIPYLPDILFFRAYHDQVASVMRLVGNIGWCFKASNMPDSPYATISLSEMTKFQRHVGTLSPDVEMELVDMEQEANVGDEVRIIGGNVFEGQEGEVTRVRKVDGKLFYSIKLTQSLYITWSELEVNSAFVVPVVP